MTANEHSIIVKRGWLRVWWASALTMLEGLLLINDVVMMARLHGTDVQGHVPCDAAADGKTGLGVED